ncbi:hypothetical protein HY493_04640 [Candidatus Woesearchaeota archaeon]|nr:hypothetical protein [Candidatus Woesearchaeota archaeon]
MRRKTKRNLLIGTYAVLIIAIAYLSWLDVSLRGSLDAYADGYRDLQWITGVGDFGSTHEHADFLVFVNGKQIDFTRPEHQEVHGLVHLEDPEIAPYVIHKHATGITYGMFFTTLDIDVGDCLTVNSKEFCDSNGRLVKYYLNGKLTPDLANAEISDVDKVLVSYGAESVSEVQQQLTSIGDNACKQSKKC